MTYYRSPEEVAALRGGVQTAAPVSPGPMVVNPSRTAAPPQPQVQAQTPSFDLSSGSFYSNLASLIPQPVKDAASFAKRAFNFIDTPISERLGIRIPDMPGPLDEIGNFALQELTRPTNIAFALPGPNLALALEKAPAAVKVASFLLTGPSVSSSFASRAIAQAVMMTGARAGADAAEKALDFANIESTPVHIAADLLGGVAGGGLALSGIRSAVKGTLGRDIVGTLPKVGANGIESVRVTPETMQEFGRQKFGISPIVDATGQAAPVLQFPTSDELVSQGKNTVAHITGLLSKDMETQGKNRIVSLLDYAREGDRMVGKVNNVDGRWFINGGKSGAKIDYLDAIEYGAAKYGADLSPDQLDGITRLHQAREAFKSAADEAGVPIHETALNPEQRFFPREVERVGANAKQLPEPLSNNPRLSLTKEQARLIPDVVTAQEAGGVRYAHPLAALEQYGTEMIRDATNKYKQTLLSHPDISSSWLDRLDKGIVNNLTKIRQQVRSTYDTLTGQEARAGEARLNSDRAQRAVESGMSRLSAQQERVTALARNVSIEDVQAARSEVTASINTALTARGQAQEAVDRAKALGMENDRMVVRLQKALDAADNKRAEAEGYLNGAEQAWQRAEQFGPGSTMSLSEANANVEATRSLQQEYRSALRQSDHLYAIHDALVENAARVGETLDAAELKAASKAADATTAAYDISSARKVERTLTRMQNGVNAAQREMRALEREQARLVRAAETTGRRDASIVAKRDATAVKLEDLRGRLVEQQAKVNDARERARLTPDGRMTLPSSQFPLLAKRDFAVDDAQRIIKAFTQFAPSGSQSGSLIGAAAAVNRIATPFRAMGDMSSALNQMGYQLFSNPIQFVRNFKKAAVWAVDNKQYDRFLSAPENQDALLHGVAASGTKMAQALRQSEFEALSWAERVPVLRELNHHFQIFTTLNRVDSYNSLVHAAESSPRAAEILKGALEGGATVTVGLSDIDKESIARALNRMSGVAAGLGKGPAWLRNGKPGDLETAALFAPGFLRSGIETIIAAAADGGIEGSLARQYIRNMVVGASMLSFAAAAAQGRNPSEVLNPFDVNSMKKGEFRLNPNFGTIRVGGQDISLYGRWDSLARMAVASMDGTYRSLSTADAKPLMQALGYGVMSKGSPLLAFGAQLATTGQTFTGTDSLSPIGLAENTLPFTASGFLSDVYTSGELGPSALGAMASFFGGKSNDLTPYEKLDVASRTMFGRTYDQLSGQERDSLKQMFPGVSGAYDRQTAQKADAGDPKAKARIELQHIDQERQDKELAAYNALQAGDIQLKQFNDALKNYSYGAAKQKEVANRVLGVDYGLPTGAQAALSAYFDTYKKAESAPDIVDFDVQAQLEGELMQRIDSGEFGDPAQAHKAIDERSRPKHSPEIQAFYDAKQRISDSGYYAVADSAYQRLRPVVSQIAGADIPTYGDFQVLLNRAIRADNQSLIARLKAVDSRVSQFSDKQRQIMRVRTPGLENDLVMVGRVDPASRISRLIRARQEQSVSTSSQ